MTTLQLQARVLQGQLGIEDDKLPLLEEAIRSFAVHTLNVSVYLREKNIDWEIARDLMEGYGVSYDGKTKKFK